MDVGRLPVSRLTSSRATLEQLEEATRVRPSVLLARLRDEIRAVTLSYGASDVRVFGSVAEGTDTTHSDLDLLVHFSDEATLYDQIALSQELQELLGICVDIVSDGAPLAERIHSAVAM